MSQFEMRVKSASFATLIRLQTKVANIVTNKQGLALEQGDICHPDHDAQPVFHHGGGHYSQVDKSG